MPTKIQQAMDILDIIPEPTTIQIIDISRKLKCSERHIWKALRRVRENRKKASEEVSIINQISSDLFFLYSLMISLKDTPRKLTAVEYRDVTRIEDYLRDGGFGVLDK